MIQTTRIVAVGALLLWSMTVAAQELVHFPSFEDNGPGRSSTVLNGYLAAGGRGPASCSDIPTWMRWSVHGLDDRAPVDGLEDRARRKRLGRRADPPRICSSDGR